MKEYKSFYYNINKKSITMENNKYDLIDVTNDISKIAYSIVGFTCKYIYKVTNLEALRDSMDYFMLSRFSQRLEYFTFEHNKLTKNEKKTFMII